MDDARSQVLEAAGHVLVLGGPGSGKTTLALRKAALALRSRLRDDQQVLFLSFSRAAIARAAEATSAEVPADLRRRLALQTLHSFFWEILRSNAYLLGAPRRLDVLLPHDERSLERAMGHLGASWSL